MAIVNSSVKDVVNTITQYISISTPYVMVTTPDYHYILDVLSKSYTDNIYLWNMKDGVSLLQDNAPPLIENESVVAPAQAVDFYCNKNIKPFKSVLVMFNAHLHFNPLLIQAILSSYDFLAYKGRTIIMLNPDVKIPVELESYIVKLHAPLPNIDEFSESTYSLKEDLGLEDLTKEQCRELARSAFGLTSVEYSLILNKLSFLLATEQITKIEPKHIMDAKLELIKNKSSFVSIYEPTKLDTFDNIVGLGNIKDFMLKMAKSEQGRGTMLLGVPGNAKSCLARALGNELKLTTVKLELTNMFNHLVGMSETRLRDSLRFIEALKPCVVWIDEIEKAFGGSFTDNDGGVATKLIAILLQWLEKDKPGIYIVATSNNIEMLPPELLRSERWDTTFFIGNPTEQARKHIWRLWCEHYKITAATSGVDDDNWSGADIRTCCRLAASMRIPVKDAAKYVIPTSKQYETAITELEEWAVGKAIPAVWDDIKLNKKPGGKIKQLGNKPKIVSLTKKDK